jgi:predicted permease
MRVSASGATDRHGSARWTAASDGILQDVRYALRVLSRAPGFSATAILMLALGIGINSAVFTVTNAVLFKGFPLTDDRIVYVSSPYQCCVSYPDLEDWRTQAANVFQDIGAVADLRVGYADEGGLAESYTATLITANGFSILRQHPALGRDFVASDATAGAPAVTILSHRFWSRRYAQDPSIIGRVVRVNDMPTTVIGVMPEGLSFPQNQEMWLPLIPTAAMQKRDARSLWFAFARLADGATRQNAGAEMATISARLAADYPQTNRDARALVQTFSEFYVGPNAATIYASLWGAVGFVLLLACANLANLLLSRGVNRSREIAVRVALGAGRWRLVRELLIESMVLSSLGGLAGWWMAKWGVRLYETMSIPPTRTWSNSVVDYSLDHRVLVYLIVISVATGVLFGLFPAVHASRIDSHAALKAGSGAGGRPRRSASSFLLAVEMAIAVVLLASAGVMVRSFLNLYSADLGFSSERLLAGLLQLPPAKYPPGSSHVAFFDEVGRRLSALPGVESIAFVDAVPGRGGRLFPYEVNGTYIDERKRPMAKVTVVSPGYFKTLGAPITSGREFDESDRTGRTPGVIVNQRFVNEYWPREVPLGQRVRLFVDGQPGAWLTVVGVVPNIAQNGAMRKNLDPLIYVPHGHQATTGMWAILRTQVPPANLGTAFRREVQAVDPDLPIWLGPFPLSDFMAESYWSSGLVGGLFLIFALFALVLASFGLHAVVANSVSQRTREIGIRIAVGASAREVLMLVAKQSAVPLTIGVIIGVVASLGVNNLLKAGLVNVSPVDPVVYVLVISVLVLCAVVACLSPAFRATRVNPMMALRSE